VKDLKVNGSLIINRHKKTSKSGLAIKAGSFFAIIKDICPQIGCERAILTIVLLGAILTYIKVAFNVNNRRGF
jgi:hypothetical protein